MSGWQRVPSTIRGKAWQKDLDDGHLTVLLSTDGGMLHMSISHRVDVDGGTAPGRYPTWDEIVDARYMFCPDDMTMAQLLPPKEEWVNFHPTTFHLWELREPD